MGPALSLGVTGGMSMKQEWGHWTLPLNISELLLAIDAHWWL
ncbi:hypothetical protein [Pacificibacter sp. AS14]